MKKYLVIILVAFAGLATFEPTRKHLSELLSKRSVAKVHFAISSCPRADLAGTKDEFFSQSYEEYILSSIFEGVNQGFYVDVGANHPNKFNITLYFHKIGWNGMNFEPQSDLYAMFQNDRPKDINIKKAVADYEGTATLYVPTLSHAATLNAKIKEVYGASEVQDLVVDVTTLSKELTSYNVKNIDFINIDVEGSEDKVIKGLDLKAFRPKVIVVEYNSPAKQDGHIDFEPMILENNYILASDDGLNRYYYRQESKELGPKFKRIDKCVRIDREARGV